jgi:protein TonB
MGPLATLVFAAHALLLVLPRQPMTPSGAPARASVEVRMLEVPAPKIAASPALAPSPEVSAIRAPAHDAKPTMTGSDVQPAEASAPVAAPVYPKADPWLGLTLPGLATDDDLYFARSQLSKAPTALDPVIVDYPRFAGDAGRYVAELSLFIDETGRVARVRIDSGSLPPPLEDAARRAFMQARFRPGEAAEHGAVKSRIRIEVSFDSGQSPGR